MDEQKRWERSHRNGKIAKVAWDSASNEYRASVQRSTGVESQPLDPGLTDEHDAKASADKMTGCICDERCGSWNPV